LGYWDTLIYGWRTFWMGPASFHVAAIQQNPERISAFSLLQRYPGLTFSAKRKLTVRVL